MNKIFICILLTTTSSILVHSSSGKLTPADKAKVQGMVEATAQRLRSANAMGYAISAPKNDTALILTISEQHKEDNELMSLFERGQLFKEQYPNMEIPFKQIEDTIKSCVEKLLTDMTWCIGILGTEKTEEYNRLISRTSGITLTTIKKYAEEREVERSKALAAERRAPQETDQRAAEQRLADQRRAQQETAKRRAQQETDQRAAEQRLADAKKSIRPPTPTAHSNTVTNFSVATGTVASSGLLITALVYYKRLTQINAALRAIDLNQQSNLDKFLLLKQRAAIIKKITALSLSGGALGIATGLLFKKFRNK